jgi:hypothetical protein
MRIVLEPGLQVDAINSEVDVALGREITLFPARVLIGPRFLQAGGRRSRQAGGNFFEQRRQRVFEVAGRNDVQVPDRSSTSRLLPGIRWMKSRGALCWDYSLPDV